jgi:hypothetical protein
VKPPGAHGRELDLLALFDTEDITTEASLIVRNPARLIKGLTFGLVHCARIRIGVTLDATA